MKRFLLSLCLLPSLVEAETNSLEFVEEAHFSLTFDEAKSASPGQVKWVEQGLKGRAGYFDGEKHLIRLKHELGNAVRTIALWFSPGESIDHRIEVARSLLMRNTSTEQGEFGLYLCPTIWRHPGKLVFTRRIRGQRFEVASERDRWIRGQWYHVVALLDEETGMQLYIDGERQPMKHDNGAPTDRRNEVVSLGSWGDKRMRFFHGTLDEVHIWRRALTPLEIKSLYFSYKPPDQTPDVSKEAMAELVERLGSTDRRERKRARNQLKALGFPTLLMLEPFQDHDDPEIRITVRELLR
ncbi:MAG: LamG domain-containing protein [Verrucomicrobiota bacterium]